MVLDDQLFGLSIVALGQLENRREVNTSENISGDTQVLFLILNRGIWDQEVMDGPNDSATRAMRYSTVMGERLWRLINGNITQVGGLEDYSFDE